jgi:flagellar basal-body rod modification protein FlgD
MSNTAIGNTYTNPDLYQVGDKTPSSSLDKNGFLKMLTEQIKNQDPTSGQDPNQYFQTISQMTTVEQLTNLASQSATTLAAQRNTSAQALIGRTVTYPGADGLPVSGVVDAVTLDAKNGPSLTVAGTSIKPDIITSVK